jgi:hypothetical protein
MKKILSLFLIVMFVSPAFGAWLPLEAIHALHKNNIEHFVMGSHDHSPQDEQEHGHSHENQSHNIKSSNKATHLSDHHPIHFDITTYFSDYLNVDLQRASQTLLEFSDLDLYDDLYDIHFRLVTGITSHHHYDLPPSKSRFPIDWQISNSSNIPPYLSTQRLRI